MSKTIENQETCPKPNGNALAASRASISLKHCKSKKLVLQSRRRPLEWMPIDELVDKRLLKCFLPQLENPIMRSLFYLGIDQHAKQLTINLRDQNGNVLLRRQVSTRPEKVTQFFEQLTALCARMAAASGRWSKSVASTNGCWKCSRIFAVPKSCWSSRRTRTNEKPTSAMRRH